MKKLSILFLLASCMFCGIAIAQNKMAIGYAYDNMGGGCAQFTTAQGYRYETSSSSETTLADLRNLVTDNLANYYSVSKNNVMVFTSTKAYGCVISYRYTISGWSCTKAAYAIGFGDTESEARANAEKQMRLYYQGDSFILERYIHL